MSGIEEPRNSRFFVEVTCQSTPTAGKISWWDFPRFIEIHSTHDIILSPDGRLVEQKFGSGYLREIDLLMQVNYLEVLRSEENWFVRFLQTDIRDPKEFHQFAVAEFARINKIIGALLVDPYPINVSDSVFIAFEQNQPYQLQEHWVADQSVAGPISITILENGQLLSEWLSVRGFKTRSRVEY